MFSGVCAFSNTGSSAFQLLRNVTSGSFLEADQLRKKSLCSHTHVTACYGELSMENLTSCKNTFAFTTEIAHSLKGVGVFQRNLCTLVKR